MRTPEGNSASSQNAIKHGLCSNQLILPDEDEQEWLAIKLGWLDDYCPQTHTSLILVLQAAEAEWLYLRARRRYNQAEQKIYDEQPDPFEWTVEQQKTIERFTRYRTTQERAFNRALRNIQAHRAIDVRCARLQLDLCKSRSLEAARSRTAEHRAEQSLARAKKESQPKKAAPPPPLEQWVQVTVEDGKPVTKFFPPNEELLKQYQTANPPPDLVYRRLEFVGSIPPAYHWAAESTPELFETGGAGIQRMTLDTWREVIKREQASGTGHIGPTGVGNLPRPKHRGACDCRVCTQNQEIIDRRESE